MVWQENQTNQQKTKKVSLNIVYLSIDYLENLTAYKSYPTLMAAFFLVLKLLDAHSSSAHLPLPTQKVQNWPGMREI